MAGKSDGSITIDTKLDTSGFEKGSDKLRHAAESLEEQMEETAEKIREASSSRTDTSAADTAEKTATRIEEMNEAANTGSEEMDEYSAAIHRFVETLQGFDTAETFEEACEVIAELISQLDEFGEKIFDINGVMTRGVDTEGYDMMVSATQELVAKMREAITPATSLSEKWLAISESAKRVSSTMGAAISRMTAGFMNLWNASKKVAATVGSLVKNSVIQGMKKLGDAIKNAASGIAKNSQTQFGGLIKSLLKFSAIMAGIRMLFNAMKSAITEGLGDIAKHDAGFARTLANFRNALALLKASLAAAFLPIAQTVLPLLTSMINTVSTAISRVGQLIAALTGKTTYMAVATTQAAQSFKDEASEAKKTQKVLAKFDDINRLEGKKDESNKAGADAGNDSGLTYKKLPIDVKLGDLAAKIKEAWEKSDFTEIGGIVGRKLKEALDNISWENIKESLRKIATDIATFLNGFLETPGLFSAIGNTIAEAINSAFAFVDQWVSDFHWDSLGKAIKDLILSTLNNIDWKSIKETMKKFGKGIGKAFQTGINSKEVWSAIFTTLAESINSLLEFVDGFLSEVDWQSLGENIGWGLNDGIERFDWWLLGETLSDLINAAFDALYGFVTTFDFEKFGAHIGETLAYVINNVDWNKGATSIAKAITGLFLALRGFIEKTQWKTLGRKVIRAVIAFFKDLKWDVYGGTLSELIKGLLEALRAAITDPAVKWDELPGYIIQAFKDFFSAGNNWSEVADEAIGLLKDALLAAVDVLKGIIPEDWDSPLTDALNSLKESITKFCEAINFEEIANGIKAVVNAMSPAAEGFAKGLVDAFSALFDIGAEFFKALGPALQKIADAINALPEGTLEAVGEALAKIAGTMLVIKGASSAVGILGGVISKVSAFGETLGALAGAGTEAAAGAGAAATGIGEVAGAATGAAGGIKAVATEAINSAGATVALGEGFEKHVLPYLTGTADETVTTAEGLTKVTDALYKTTEPGKKVEQTLAEVTTQMLNLHSKTAVDFTESFNKITQSLNEAGINTDEFKTALSELLQSGEFNSEQAAVISKYIEGIGTSAETADTGTVTLQDSLGAFAGLSWSTPLKLALISGAIDLLAKSGKLSKSKADELHKTLDDYDPKHPKKSMKEVGEAFENAGISTDTALKAIIESAKTMNRDLDPEFKRTVSDVQKAAEDSEKYAKDGADNAVDGVVNSITDGTPEVEEATKSMAKEGIKDAMDDELDEHSPSKEMYTRGENAIEGLKNGIDSMKESVKSTVKEIARDMLDSVDEIKNDFYQAGESIMQNFSDGLQSGKSDATNKASSLANDIRGSFDLDWHGIGRNICSGIVDGIEWGWNWVMMWARSIAGSALWEAKRELGIASPSKEFAWVGKMITEGFGNGIRDNEDNAVNAVSDLASAVIAEAENNEPTMKISTSVTDLTGELDSVLNTFSDHVVSSFSSMISAMENIASGSGFIMPAAANGSIIPYASGRSGQASGSSVDDLISALSARDSDRLTRSDLVDVLTDVCRRYLNIEFYLGDEQVARHANAGNLKLNRRYETA